MVVGVPAWHAVVTIARTANMAKLASRLDQERVSLPFLPGERLDKSVLPCSLILFVAMQGAQRHGVQPLR